MTKANVKNKTIDPQLIKQLLEHADSGEFFGKDGFFQQLKQSLVNGILNAEMDHHLGFEKHSRNEKPTDNRRNGAYAKKILSDGDHLDIAVPRDRAGDFVPQIVPKGVRRLDGFDEKVISMYARGMTVREIQDHLYEIYGTDVSPDLISQVTDSVMEEVNAWTARPLDSVYPILFLDCIFVKARDNHMVISKAVYMAVGVNQEGHKEVLGIWIAKTEGAKFWMQVITELKNRGVQDILMACVDGLNGFDEAIRSIFPLTTVQTCIVHLIRNSLKYVPWKNKKAVAQDLKAIYTAPTQEAAEIALQVFKEKWDQLYPTISDQWQRQWDKVIPQIAFPEEIRRVIYTTNVIESMNRQIRKIVKNKGVFPTDESIKKILYLALKNAAKRWTMPIRNWPDALNQFAVLYPDRLRLFTQSI